MVYADENRIKTRLKAYNNTDEDLIQEAITSSDNKINQYLSDELPGYKKPDPTPSTLIEAGVLLASSCGVDILFANSEQRQPSAIQWEEEAYKTLDKYINQYETDVLRGGCNIYIDSVYNKELMDDKDTEDK